MKWIYALLLTIKNVNSYHDFLSATL